MQSSSVIRRDALGRVRVPRSAREQILKEFDQSGLSGARFARLIGVKYSTFACWRSKRARSRSLAVSALPKPKVQWAEAVVERAELPQDHSSLTIALRSGASIQLRHASQVNLAAVLLRELERAC
jgi:hypothetical protein